MLRMIVLKPDCEPYVHEATEDKPTFKLLQKAVGGCFDVRPIPNAGCTLYFNDNAAVDGKGSELNFDFLISGCEHALLGDVVIVRDEVTDDGVDSVSVTDEDVKFFTELFSLNRRASYTYELKKIKTGDLDAGMQHKFTKRNAVGSVPNARITEPRFYAISKEELLRRYSGDDE